MSDYHKELDLIQAHLEKEFAGRIEQARYELEYIEAERNAALEAIARLRRAFTANSLNAIAGVELSAFHTRPAKTLTAAVNRVIKDFIVGEFDINTVIGFVIRHHPEIKQPINPTSVSGILRSLWDEEVLEQIKAGAGPKPAVYKLTESGRESIAIENEFKLELEREG